MATRLLRIGKGFALPLQWMTMSSVVYGTRGSGKSTLGRKLAEEVSLHRQRFCAIDPTGAWWGLKSTAAGDNVGLPVIIFGGDHADVPLEYGAGALIADVVAEIDQSVILDLEYLSKGKQIAFLGDFLERLYHINRDPLLLLMDEAQRYAPQKPMSVEANKTLGAAEDIVKLGRKHGLGPVVFTQRGSGLNKEVSELADVLIAFRTPGVLDQGRIKDWLEANATAEQMREVMGSISGLPTGTAIFASNHPDLKLFVTVAIDLPNSFDSSATPQVGQRRREPRILAKPDLEALRGKMSEAIERAKAVDPKELRKRIAQLEAQKKRLEDENGLLAQAHVPERVVERVEVIVEVPIVDEETYLLLAKLTERLGDVTMIAAKAKDAIRARPVALASSLVPPPARLREPTRAIIHEVRSGPVPDDEIKLGGVERKVLHALAQHPEGLSRVQLAFIAGYSPQTSTLGVGLGRLRAIGYVTKGTDPIRATEEGVLAAGPIERLPVPGPELVDHWMGKLGGVERKVLQAMIEAHPDQLSRAEVAERAGYSLQTSTLGVGLGKLRRLKLIDGWRVSEALVGR